MAKRTRMRLSSGWNSAERRRSTSRPSPASTMVSRRCEFEPGGGQQAQFGEDGWLGFLGLVEDQHRAAQRAIDVGLPALAQDLGAGPAVVRLKFDAEEVAELAVEVAEVGLRAGDHADGQVALLRQMLGEDAQSGRLAGAGGAGDEGDAAFRCELPNPPAEAVDPRGDVQGLGQNAGGEGVPRVVRCR